MKKKILAGLLSAMMVVSLAACGNSETGATATESKSETTANTADGTAAAATDAQGGYEGKEVKVWISSGAEDDIYREMTRSKEILTLPLRMSIIPRMNWTIRCRLLLLQATCRML